MAGRVLRAKSSELRAAWLNPELPLKQAAAGLGISVDTLQYRAKTMGLPARPVGRRVAILPSQHREFRLLWQGGVSARRIGEHFGCSYFAVISAAVRLSLPARGHAYQPKLTLDAAKQVMLRVSMQAHHQAGKTRAAE